MSIGFWLALLITLAWVPLYVFRAEDTPDALPHYGSPEKAWVVATPIAITAHIILCCMLLSSAPEISAPAAALGAAMVAAGVAFWLWARAQIGPLRVRRLPDEPPLRFRSDGAFGIVRNPLYFGMLLLIAAPTAMLHRPAPIATFAICTAVLCVRAAQEERRLRQQLGPVYDEYCRRVKRLIPLLW